tara:strand:- start:217 stop:678 length:462 start_codon:yes stop_codon:yes gene_type:complete
MERIVSRKKKILGSRRNSSSYSRSRLGFWLVVIAASGLTGCQHLKTGLATSAIVGATSALVPGAIVAPAVLGGVTAATVSALTAVPQAQASEINADTVIQEAPANFFDLLGSLVEMGGWLLVLIFVVPMLLGWLLPGPLTTHGKKKKQKNSFL